MLYFGLPNDYSDGRLAVPDVTRPISISEGRQAASHSFVQAVGADLDGMLDAIDVATGDSAGAKRHANVGALSLFIRH
jgi:hypothetical protein